MNNISTFELFPYIIIIHKLIKVSTYYKNLGYCVRKPIFKLYNRV